MEDRSRECRKCDLVWGIAGAVFGTTILAIAADLITHGAITRAFTRRSHLAPVVPIRSDTDAPGHAS